MTMPQVVSRDRWLAERAELLELEEELARLTDAVNARRRQLPMVEVDHDYVFEGPAGPTRLRDLFGGLPQLIVQHFMFDPDWDSGCPSCAETAGEISAALLAQLRLAGTAFAVVSLAPLSKLRRYQAECGWTFPWYSSFGSAFNYDYHVTLDERVAPVVYNYQPKEEILADGEPDDLLDTTIPVEVPGISCFLRDGQRVFHTYSAYASGVEQVGHAHSLLELTPQGG
jgi:predicted dithiol-disulfide oxidoreductase (DUF899 family)